MPEYPTDLQPFVSSLPSLVDQVELNLNDLHVVRGLTPDLAEQLTVRSQEKDVQEYCPNDAPSRFASVESARAWQAKGRLSLPLVKKAGGDALELMGFGWIGPGKPTEEEPQIPGAKVTFAIRLYQGATRQGNALPYTRAILEAHDVLYGNRGVWLETWGDNEKAVKTYEKAGFELVAETQGERHGKQYPRLYMTLGKLVSS